MGSIQEWWLKIKPLGIRVLERGLGDWGVALLFVLASVAAFGLGRLSVLEERGGVQIGDAAVSSESRSMVLGGQFVASRTGSVYYFPWCGGAQQIAADAQVWFVSESAAQKAGYRPAKNCRGLGEAAAVQ